MKNLIYITMLLLIFSSNSYARICSSDEPTTCIVSIIHLIAKPDDFNKKIIVVSGVYDEFEDTYRLYLDHEKYERRMSVYAVELELSEIQKKSLRDLKGEYVQVKGLYDSDLTGVIGISAGTVTKVTKWLHDERLQK